VNPAITALGLPTSAFRVPTANCRLQTRCRKSARYGEEDARILTDHVLDAALSGYDDSGLPKLLNVVDAADFRRPRRPVSVTRELLDGGNNSGMIAAYLASEATIERAQANSLAIVCLANTWMTGRSAYYCGMIARAGLVVIHRVASPPRVSERPGKHSDI
jgi:LDH2 family malate/lactate/ureidoglycolate dehydrogenase